MNAFALILLSFPFYLAVKGRLTAYTSLAVASATAAAPATSSGSAAPSQVPPVTPIPAI